VPSHRYRARRALVVLCSYRGVEEKDRDDCAVLQNCFAQNEVEGRIEEHRNGRGILESEQFKEKQWALWN
jgi:hypothetical protein